MTNKEMSTTHFRRTKARVKLCAVNSLPVFSLGPSKKPHCGERLRIRQGRTVVSCIDTKTFSFPIGEASERGRNYCVQDEDQNPMNIQKVAEPYLVPITTKSFNREIHTKSSKVSETKKVALIPRPGYKRDCSTPTVNGVRVTSVASLRKPRDVFVNQKPIPPPKIVSERELKGKRESLHKEADQRRHSRNEGRELAYLVVDLTTRPSLRPQKSFDDFDVPVSHHFKEQRTTLTRSFSMSASENQMIKVKTPIEDLRQDSDASHGDQKKALYECSTFSASNLDTPLLPPKRNITNVLSLPQDSSPAGRVSPKNDRRSKDRKSMPFPGQCDDNSDSELVESSALSDLSSDAFLSSNEGLDNSERSHSVARRPPSKPTPYSEYKKKRRTPPPPPKSTSPFSPSPSFPPPPVPVSACTYTPSTASSSQSVQSLSPLSACDSNSVRELASARLDSSSERKKNTHEQRRTESMAVSREVRNSHSLSASNVKTPNSPLPYKYKPTQPPPRPLPLNRTLQQKVRNIKQAGQSKQTSVQQQTKGTKPFISNPQLISSTKNIPGTPISGLHRNLSSPDPPTVFGSLPTFFNDEDSTSQLEDYSEDDANSYYEVVNLPDPGFLPRQTCLIAPGTRRFTSDSGPVLPPKPVQSDPMPRRLLSTQINRHVQPHPPINKHKASNSSSHGIRDSKDRPLRQISSPEPSGNPEDYIDPLPLIGITNSEDGWQRNKSFNEDGLGEEYVEMGSVLVGTLETTDDKEGDLSDGFIEDSDQDCPEDSYVDMHPVGDPYSQDVPEPIYMEMKTNCPVDPPKKSESLYYASADLFLLRPDLTVKKKSKAKGSRF